MNWRRIWEIIPGALTWLTFILLIYWSIFSPNILELIVLLYAVYWLIKVEIITYYLIAGYIRYRKEIRINWLERLTKQFDGGWHDLYHMAIIPTYKEDIEVLRTTINAIIQSNYPNNRIIVVVAFEERDKEKAPIYSKQIQQEFSDKFFKLIITMHPGDIEGEVKGKGPNITWAARQSMSFINQQELPYDKVIVTTLDADNRVDKNYFANLAYEYLKDPDPTHKSFQPIPLFFNNIWQVPLPVKMVSLGSSYWQLVISLRPYLARNFSAHSQSLAALVKTDFWSVKTIVEDGHQFWRSYYAFSGNHYVVPIFVPVYMDAVEDATMSQTFKALYLQRRRWFWGVSDVPFVFCENIAHKEIPFFSKWLEFLRLFDSHYSLATQPFILLAGWLPFILHRGFGSTVIGYNYPTVYQYLLSLTWVGMIASMLIAAMLVPPRPGKHVHYLLYILREWLLAPILLPITGILFSSIPSIDSQTRLMLNKPLNVFNVTKKIVKTG